LEEVKLISRFIFRQICEFEFDLLNDMEINYGEQIAANVRQLEEFDAMVFELEYKMVGKNIAIGTRMYELMSKSKRIEQLKRKIAEVEGGQMEMRRNANETSALINKMN
jgi:hypothetical protein